MKGTWRVESKRVVFAFMRGSTALLIGNFDGLHLGHRELVRTARGQVGPDGRVLALVFEPHPAQVLRPESVPPRLTTADGRRSLLVQAGVDEVIEGVGRTGVVAVIKGRTDTSGKVIEFHFQQRDSSLSLEPLHCGHSKYPRYFDRYTRTCIL